MSLKELKYRDVEIVLNQTWYGTIKLTLKGKVIPTGDMTLPTSTNNIGKVFYCAQLIIDGFILAERYPKK